MTPDCVIEPLAENALLLRFGDALDAAINARVHAAAHSLRDAHLPGIIDIAPAYATLLVRFDPLAWCGPTDGRPFTQIIAQLQRLVEGTGDNSPLPLGEAERSERARSANRRAGEGSPSPSPTDHAPSPLPVSRQEMGSAEPEIRASVIDIPVCYGGEYGLDLDAVAAHARLTPAQVIERHTAGTYTVAMLGFAPGFPYLLGLDAALQTPRQRTPRTHVPAGSVAIGGAQAGIYPRDLPGGWNLIGRTPRVLFDPRDDPPCLFAPGDRVRFHAIDAATFPRLFDAAHPS